MITDVITVPLGVILCRCMLKENTGSSRVNYLLHKSPRRALKISPSTKLLHAQSPRSPVAALAFVFAGIKSPALGVCGWQLLCGHFG